MAELVNQLVALSRMDEEGQPLNVAEVALGELELSRLFDRFYRADKARTFTGGYGVGLSMAKAIVEKHKGEISAYKKDATHIGFKVVL